jgi:hypothetical protein
MLEHRVSGLRVPCRSGHVHTVLCRVHSHALPRYMPRTYVNLPVHDSLSRENGVIPARFHDAGVGSAGGRNGQGRLEVGGGAMERIDIIAEQY